MAKKKLYKSKTNFTLRRLHQSGSYGTIYERDYTTVAKFPSDDNGQISVYTGPTFKLTVRPGLNGQKKYRHGNWLINNGCETPTTNWTLACLPEANKVDSKIVLKPNSRKLTDFACYGSAYELIKSTIADIIINFPAEIYVTNKTLESTKMFEVTPELINSDLGKYYETKYKKYFIVKNPLHIDIIQSVIPEDNELSPLRFFCDSAIKYTVISNEAQIISSAQTMAEEGAKLKFWDAKLQKDKPCLTNGDILAEVTFSNDKEALLEIVCVYYENSILYLGNKSGYRIRPNKETIDNFFENLSDFGKVLLNPQTEYTSIFETYEETEEDGWVMFEETYKWPIGDGGWNISTNGSVFSEYVSKLSDLAFVHDELFTNSIWRDMTHEAISNMDLTITSNGEENILDSSKMQKLLNIIGRQFDEIKKYADNIKKTNIITFTQEGNTPDYFLSDNLEMSGWETKEIFNGVSNNIITPSLYGALAVGYTASDANNEFMRRLKLNSKQILSEKGTKRCIEDLMAIFGYHSTDWLRNYKFINNETPDLTKAFKIIENVYVAKGYTSTDSDMHLKVQRINASKDDFFDYDFENGSDPYQGLPVTDVTYTIKNEKDEEETITKLIPWVDKNKEYDSGLYFQMKGGWARNDGNGEYKYDKIPEYDYTISKIHYVPTLDDLYTLLRYKLDKTGIYYVGNLNQYYRLINEEQHVRKEGWELLGYNEVDLDEETINKIIYKEVENFPYQKVDDYTYIKFGEKYYKWDDNITILENIVDNNKGNNPHTGQYDSGASYYEAFGNIFKYSKFNNVRKEVAEENRLYGFDIERQADSTKCVFVSDTNKINEDLAMLRGESKIKPYNFFTGNYNESGYTEIDSLSVINTKEMHIIFAKAHQEFLEKDVLPYVKQVIPSTTIFSYSFEDLNIEKDKFEARNKDIICDGELCPIYGVKY